MRVALCQLNSVVGDVDGNAARILAFYHEAREHGADLVAFPELALSGYPPRDLLELPDFVDSVEAATTELARHTGASSLLFGAPMANPEPRGKALHNGAVLCANGKILRRVAKKLLPTYDVFDETRHFEADPSPAEPVAIGGIAWGVHICEDAWNEDGFWPRSLYRRDPVSELVRTGARILLNLSASPFHARKISLRRSMFESHCRHHQVPLLYTNAVGGNDELVFDGEAYVFDARGALLACGEPFEEEVLLVDIDPGPPVAARPLYAFHPGNPGGDPGGRPGGHPVQPRPELDELDSIYRALVLGLRDYAQKCGFRTAVLGLSGGIDSALTAVLAVRALGAEHVHAVALPSRYSSRESVEDAEILARRLGIGFEVLSIEPPFTATLDVLTPHFGGRSPGVTAENIQARIRGLYLMALSNQFGHLLLTTGNKSELAVGYCTLYGDMAGGLAVISDLPKTTVYALSRWINREGEVIPERSLTKAPSAELRPDQTDQDTLPPYPLLDRILEGYIEDGLRIEDMVARGLPESTVRWVIERIAEAEYKRRQAAPGIKISPRPSGSAGACPSPRAGRPARADSGQHGNAGFGRRVADPGPPDRAEHGRKNPHLSRMNRGAMVILQESARPARVWGNSPGNPSAETLAGCTVSQIFTYVLTLAEGQPTLRLPPHRRIPRPSGRLAIAASKSAVAALSWPARSLLRSRRRRLAPRFTPDLHGMERIPYVLAAGPHGPLRGDVYLPDHTRGAPVVVGCHGFKGFKDWGFWPETGRRHAEAGLVLVTFNFSGSGIGEDLEVLSELDRFESNTIGKELEDLGAVLDAVALRAVPLKGADARRLGLLGHSRGGGVALVRASRDPRVRAVATWSAVSSFTRFGERDRDLWRRQGYLEVENQRTKQVLRVGVGLLEDLEAHGDAYDPVLAAKRLRVSALVIHGEADESVPVEEGRKLARALGPGVGELAVIPGAGHTFGMGHPPSGTVDPAFETVLSRTVAWFQEHLAG
jgi:NAD+ synthetase